jgi:hypothetical protein
LEGYLLIGNCLDNQEEKDNYFDEEEGNHFDGEEGNHFEEEDNHLKEVGNEEGVSF